MDPNTQPTQPTMPPAGNPPVPPVQPVQQVPQASPLTPQMTPMTTPMPGVTQTAQPGQSTAVPPQSQSPVAPQPVAPQTVPMPNVAPVAGAAPAMPAAAPGMAAAPTPVAMPMPGQPGQQSERPPDATTGPSAINNNPPSDPNGQLPGADMPAEDYDPSKSPSEQMGAKQGEQDAKKVTKLPLPGMNSPLPAIGLGVVILIFLLLIGLYAFMG